MAAAATAAKQGSWIARMWRMGWEKIPVVMMGHCITTPILVLYLGNLAINGIPKPQPEKYRTKYTVVRPGDPIIARINHHSPYDKVGIFE